jgi:hypothetical protein
MMDPKPRRKTHSKPHGARGLSGQRERPARTAKHAFRWRLLRQCDAFHVCETYPGCFLVPAISAEQMQAVSALGDERVQCVTVCGSAVCDSV